jgi:hypothetical protein
MCVYVAAQLSYDGAADGLNEKLSEADLDRVDAARHRLIARLMRVAGVQELTPHEDALIALVLKGSQS